MENSSLFIRGQVWYWEDPIYGRKENNINVSIGEATVRYNRYCIVAQTTNTIDRSSVLVIPCSSTNHTQHDIQAPLAHVFRDNFTYARTRGIFPVHPRFLQKYICTLPENTMKQIELKLIELLIPSMHDAIKEPEFLERFEMNVKTPVIDNDIPKRDPMMCEVNIRSFIRDHIITSDMKDSISAYEMKDAFDQYCIIHNMPVIDDIVEFLDIFLKITNKANHHFHNTPKLNLLEFKGLKIKGNLKVSIIMHDKDLINPEDPQRPGKWDDDSIDDFITIYNRDGAEAAAAKYDLKLSTAANYWYRWKDRLDARTPPTLVPKVPTTVDTPRSISKMANIIRDTLREDPSITVYNKYVLTNGANAITSSDFFNNIGTCVYYSLLDFLSIHKDESGEFLMPNLNENSNYLNTWHFFDHLYHDFRISTIRNGVEVMEAYRKYFPENGGIDAKWINRLRYRLNNRIDIPSNGIDEICSRIEKLYCG